MEIYSGFTMRCTHLARSMNTTHNATLFKDCILLLGLAGAVGYPIRAIEVNIRCSLCNEMVSVDDLHIKVLVGSPLLELSQED